MNGFDVRKHAAETAEEDVEKEAQMPAVAEEEPAKPGSNCCRFNSHWEDEGRLDDRVAGSNRVIEMDKDEFERYLAQYEPGGMNKWKTWFNTRSIFFLPLLAPWGSFYRFWYLLILCLDLCYTAFVFPYNEAWKIDDQTMYTIEAALGLCFVLDVCINLHAPYVLRFKNAKLLLRNGVHVFWLYLTQDTLVIDAVTAMTFFVITVSVLSTSIDTTSDAWGYARAIRLLRLYRIYLIMKTLVLGTWVHAFVSMRVASSRISIRSVYLLGMSYSALVLINCLACLWWFVGNLRNETKSWPMSAGGLGDIVGYPHWKQYVSSIYYVVTTITTTGYGDITPQNSVEQIFAMVTMGCGALFFAFLIGSVVGQIMQSGAAARRSAKFKEKIQVVEQFMKANCVSKGLHNKIFRFYSDVWMRQQEEEELWDSIDDLGPTLKAQLLVEMVGPYIRALPPFHSLSDLALLALSGLLEPLPLAPEMDICKHGDVADCLWILQEGSVALLKGEKQVSGPVWAPGLLGMEALKPVLKPLELSLGSLRHKTAAPGADSGTGAGEAVFAAGPRDSQHAAGGGDKPAPRGAADSPLQEPSQDEEQVVQPFTLRTLRTCTLFCLPVPKLMSLLANIDPWEAYEIENGLRLAMGSADEVLGHASRKAVRAPRADSVSSKSKKSADKSSLMVSSTATGGGSRAKTASAMKSGLQAPSRTAGPGPDPPGTNSVTVSVEHSVITVAKETGTAHALPP